MISTKVWPIATMPVMAAASIRSVRPWTDRKRLVRRARCRRARPAARPRPASRAGAGRLQRRASLARPPAAAAGCLDGAHAADSWPVAASMIRSCVASARDELLHQPALAHHEHAVGDAEHLGQLAARSSARPCPATANSPSMRCTSAFVPTSMPRVGSSITSSFGLVASHLASTTFCWLPPDSRSTGCSRPECLAAALDAHSSATSRSSRAADQAARGGGGRAP